MTALAANGSRRILAGDPKRGGAGIDREATLHRLRKNAMVSLLSEFERELEPHIKGRNQEIVHFKESCRRKLNSIVWEAIELMTMEPGEKLNEAAADLAGDLYDANGGQAKP